MHSMHQFDAIFAAEKHMKPNSDFGFLRQISLFFSSLFMKNSQTVKRRHLEAHPNIYYIAHKWGKYVILFYVFF